MGFSEFIGINTALPKSEKDIKTEISNNDDITYIIMKLLKNI